MHKISATSISLFLFSLSRVWLNILLGTDALWSSFIPQFMLSMCIRTVFTIITRTSSLKMSTNHSFIIWSIRICSHNLLTRYKGIIVHSLWQKRIHIIIVRRKIYRKSHREIFLMTYRIVFRYNRLVWVLEAIIIVLKHLRGTTSSESSASCSSL